MPSLISGKYKQPNNTFRILYSEQTFIMVCLILPDGKDNIKQTMTYTKNAYWFAAQPQKVISI